MKKLAIELRKKGYPYSEIAKELSISKSTAYLWLKNIKLSSAEEDLLQERLTKAKQKQILNLAKINKSLKLKRDNELNNIAKNIVSEREPGLHDRKLLCSFLFWCEGGKDISSGIHFINSDPDMVYIFLSLLRDSFEIDERKFRALLHLHSYHDVNKQTDYWSKITSIPKEQFYKPFMKENGAKNIRKGYPGCISIRYHDRPLGKLLEMIYTEFVGQYRGVR